MSATGQGTRLRIKRSWVRILVLLLRKVKRGETAKHGAAVAQGIRLRHVKRTKINKKRPVLAHFFKNAKACSSKKLSNSHSRSNFFTTLMTASPSVIIRWVWDLLEIEKLVQLRSNLRLRLVALRTAKNVLLCNAVGSNNDNNVVVVEGDDKIDDRDMKIILASVLERIEHSQWREIDDNALLNNVVQGNQSSLAWVELVVIHSSSSL